MKNKPDAPATFGLTELRREVFDEAMKVVDKQLKRFEEQTWPVPGAVNEAREAARNRAKEAL